MANSYDFSGFATVYGIKCSDGRTIMPDAFAHCDGETVSLVYNHDHENPEMVLGRAYLESRPEGIYAYGSLNNNPMATVIREEIKHGDISTMSIYANKLQQGSHGEVYSGNIREVSLVLSGANPGAKIDSILMHGAMTDEAIIHSGMPIDMEPGVLYHADEDYYYEEDEEPMTREDILDTLDEDQAAAVLDLLDDVSENAADEGYDAGYDDGGADAYDEGYDDALDDVDDLAEEYDEEYDDEDYDDYDDEEDYDDMRHSAFEDDGYYGSDDGAVLSHSDLNVIFGEALAHSKEYGGFKDALRAVMPAFGLDEPENYLAHAGDYGINNLDVLLPDYHNLNGQPIKVQRDKKWVDKIMNGVTQSPFKRIKSTYADLTPEEARAKGYLKGNYKLESVFSLLKRTTTPQTCYVKQALDRDDMEDITDYDTASMLAADMRVKLNEELASAILFGDGRNVNDDQHIHRDKIRPIASDDDFFTIKYKMGTSGMDAKARANAFIDAMVRSVEDYQGTGTPDLFTFKKIITECLLLKDTIGHRLYKTRKELADAMGVGDIIEVPVSIWSRGGSDLLGIIIDIADYTKGGDKGPSNMFTQFDIDFNKNKWLLETRCCGALTIPFSAVTIREDKTTTTDTCTTFDATVAAVRATGKADMTSHNK